MSLIDKSSDFSGLAPYSGLNKINRVSYTIDFSASGYSLAQNDVMVLEDDLTLGTCILSAKIKITTAQATITDVDLGLDATATHVTSANLIDGATLAATGWESTGVVTTVPVWVTADGTGIVFTNKDAQTLNSAVIQIDLIVVNP